MTLPTILSLTATDKKICESFDCTNEATLEIELSAGKFGAIVLNLCEICLPKFDLNEDNSEHRCSWSTSYRRGGEGE